MGKIIGIDLGTTNSLAAICGQDGPSVLPLAGGATFLPSAVGMDPGEGLVVGKRARDGLRLRPESTILSVKRHMGTDRRFVLGGEELRPQDVSALILRELKRSIETQLLTPVERVVISVPAYFNEVQRRATREAGEIAGLRVERLISEPTAAALAYGIERLDTEGSILVYDLGGGTFDVSILEKMQSVGQGLVVARARVDSLWSASLVSRRLRSLINCIEQRRESWPESDRGSLEEKLGRARQALQQGNAEQVAKLVEELAPWE